MTFRDKFLSGLIISSVALNVGLAVKLMSLERSLYPVPRIRVGALLEDVTGTDPNGLPLTIHFADSKKPTVLLILRPGCQWCDRNMPNWKALIQEKGRDFQFVAVSLSGIGFKEYLETKGLAVSGVFASKEKNPTLKDITGTPQTIVVGPDGIVRKVWFGAYAPEVKHQVEAFFGVTLPVVIGPST